MTQFDAHVHSAISDGTDSPSELVALASKAGLDAFALTDHDTLAGIDEATRAANQMGIDLIPGVELSTKVGEAAVHLLAYYPDPQNVQLNSLMARLRAGRTERMHQMVDLMAPDFEGVSWDELTATVAPGVSLGRPHLADLLIRNGHYLNREAAFNAALHPDGPYYVNHWSPTPDEMVAIVRQAGGVPVIAHPLSTRRRSIDRGTLEKMVDAGLFGIERDHREHDRDARRQVDALAAEYGLQVTGGSDYHGTGKPNRLGENLTDPAVLELIRQEAGA